MKTLGRLRIVALLFVAVGCGSSGAVNPLAPEIRIEQLPASEFVVQQRDAVSIAYRMTVRNRLSEPITLRQLAMKTIGRSPYVLRDTPAAFDDRIEPGEEKVLTFSMWAYPQAGRAKPTESVWVQGTAYFEGVKGKFETSFTQSFRQPAGE